MPHISIFAGLLFLLLIHAPDGEEVAINVSEISSIRQPQKGSQEHFAKDTRCIIIMTNAKFIATRESCKEVIDKIAALSDHNEQKP